MRYRGVIFDLDGTLLDTLADIAAAANEALVVCGFEPHDQEAYRQFVGNGVATLFRRAVPITANIPSTVNQCVEIFEQAYQNRWKRQTRLYDGIAQMLDALTERRVCMTVLSNKPDMFTRNCVKHYLNRWDFAVVQGQCANMPPKPDPAGGREIIKNTCFGADEFIYLGDSDVDMQTACSLGVVAVGAGWGFRPIEELHFAGAGAVVSHPSELIAIVDGHQRIG